MLVTLIVVVILSLSLSCMCSLMESTIYAVPLAHVRYLAEQGSRKGAILLQFKEDIGKPIAAILILNTIANTIGAAVSGAIVVHLFGDAAVIVFSIVFTLLILYLSEIFPKQIGAVYSKRSAEFIAYPLLFLTKLLHPLVLVTEGFSRFIRASHDEPTVSEHEVLSLAEIGREEGVLDHLEGSVIRNVVGLDRLLVRDVLTPRVVVSRESENTVLEELRTTILEWNFTRVPLYREDEPDNISSYVIQRDLFRAFLAENTNIRLKDISRPMTTVSEFMRADKLLLQMFEMKESICSVVDEHGAFAGIVTLEDIIEEIVGREIVDEYDLVTDLRSYAQILYSKKKREQESKV